MHLKESMYFIGVQIKIDVVETGPSWQAWHSGHCANEWVEEAGPHTGPDLPNRDLEASGRAFQFGVGRKG